MSFEKLIKIPNERIGVLIGKSGKTKKIIEDECSVELDIDSNGGEVLVKRKTLINEEACEKIIIRTRQYAKRQLKWFDAQEFNIVIDADDINSDDMVDKITQIC